MTRCARGLDPAEAAPRSLRRFGGIEQMKEGHRDDRSARWIENSCNDVRYGLAALRREPGVHAGGGRRAGARHRRQHRDVQPRRRRAASSRCPSPIPSASSGSWEAPTATTTNSTTTRNFVELKQQSRSFEALSAESPSTATVLVNGEPTRLNGRYVSADHFAVFGVQPFIGRTFRAEEDQAGAPASSSSATPPGRPISAATRPSWAASCCSTTSRTG